MLNFPYFGHGLLKRYVIAFGALFSNVNIARTNLTTGVELSYFKVPLTFASKDKMLVRLSQDPEILKASGMDLPVMSFEYNMVGYDKERSLNRNLTILGPTVGPSNVATTLTPVPYNIAFQLYAYVKFEEDGQKIIEQILPFFHPDMTLTLSVVDEVEITRDVPIILHGVNMEDKYEGAFIDRPVKIWTLSFTMKAYLFGPTVNRPLIKFVNVQTWAQGNAALAEEVNATPVLISNTYPGMDANGNPTTNTILTINPLLINWNDDWAVITVFTDKADTTAGAYLRHGKTEQTLDGTTTVATGTVENV